MKNATTPALAALLALALLPWSAPAAAGAQAAGFDTSLYAEVLKKYVNERGLVSYRRLKADRTKLDTFVRKLGGLKRATYDGWNEKDKIAFWTNAYNAITLKVIIDNYPIKSGWFKSRIFPKNSIHQISGAWKKITHRVMGAPITLDAIEHQKLRKLFDEPRIHVALVCAAMGCPFLRTEPYVGKRLDAQLDDQTRRFLAVRSKFKIDRGEKEVHLSSIFKWFGSDFERSYGTKTYDHLSDSKRAVINFIAKYLDKSDAAWLKSTRFSVSYLDYDWTLNER